MREHPIWWPLTAACVAWYSTVTVYVAIRGAIDIKTMLAHLSGKQLGPTATGTNNSQPTSNN